MKKLNILLVIVSFLVLQANAQESDCAPFHVSAFDDFTAVDKKGYVPFYKENKRKGLAVNSVEYPGQYSIAGYTFKNKKGKYGIEINTVLEIDGECTYKVLVNGRLVSEVRNKPSEVDWTIQTLDCGTVKLKPGDVITVEFNSHTNGKIPEGEATAYARGRWTGLKISPVCK